MNDDGACRLVPVRRPPSAEVTHVRPVAFATTLSMCLAKSSRVLMPRSLNSPFSKRFLKTWPSAILWPRLRVSEPCPGASSPVAIHSEEPLHELSTSTVSVRLGLLAFRRKEGLVAVANGQSIGTQLAHGVAPLAHAFPRAIRFDFEQNM